ncbi:MAG TPA: 4'-phosphopantetheinyl transferase superfamily protein [bacterium]|nr:4'-phosphopantetheinyl transferase superfamily protein [bacterium]
MMSSGIETIDVKKIAVLLKSAEYKKYFTPSEVDYCRRYKDMYIHLAGCLAAKFAFLKAISPFSNFDFSDVEIRHANSGKPFVSVSKNHNFTISLSISHTKTVAVALCVITDGKHFSARKKKRFS